MAKYSGIVAAGHDSTAQAAAEVLRVGGNAFDAALAALFASCVAEPVLASLGGGGFMLAHSQRERPLLYDFFTQTPGRKSDPEAIDFHPILADFGTAQQEFHIGLGSIATPGVVKGVFAIHRDLCRLPLKEIVQPACAAAREGIEINAFQHYIADIVSPIIKSTPAALQLHATRENPNHIASPAERVYHNQMADAFEHLATEGEALFYQGEMGQEMLKACHTDGGHLTRQDLIRYQVERRAPLELSYHSARLFTNPAPSVGGTLIAFSLALLESQNLGQYVAGSAAHLACVAEAQRLTQQLRREKGVDVDLDEDTSRRILEKDHVRSYRESMKNHHHFPRGTTQISVADNDGNIASMTLSNGEGSGYVIPGTGIMLNNMLGEEDINPHGFHQWPENRRIASMMSPTLVLSNQGQAIATGSGGSNRIRSAILQVLIGLLDFHMGVERSVEAPRLHYEGKLLNLEAGTDDSSIQRLFERFPEHCLWPEKNLFFGGAHTVLRSPEGLFPGKGDSRRGGACLGV